MSDIERGLFVVIEGCDKAGKTTQTELLQADLETQGRKVVVTREPGGTEDGERIRDFLLNRDPNRNPLTPSEQALGFYLSRSIHLRERVVPALERGEDVITDRLDASTFVYQGVAQGVDFNLLLSLRQHIVLDSGYRPDLTVFLDITTEEYVRRLLAENDERKKLVYEKMGPKFMEKVLRGYRLYYCGIREEHPRENRMALDGMRSKEEIHRDIALAVDETRRLGRVSYETKMRFNGELRKTFDELINKRYEEED